MNAVLPAGGTKGLWDSRLSWSIATREYFQPHARECELWKFKTSWPKAYSRGKRDVDYEDVDTEELSLHADSVVTAGDVVQQRDKSRLDKWEWRFRRKEMFHL